MNPCGALISWKATRRTLAGSTWDTATRRELRALTGHQSFVDLIVFAPDGKTLASASQDTTVRFWDTATGQPLPPPLRGSRAGVNAVRKVVKAY